MMGRNGISLDSLNDFLGRLGLRAENRHVPDSYRVRVFHKTPGMTEFERPLNGPLPGYDIIHAIDPAVNVLLTMQDGDRADTRGDVVTIGPRGGRVAAGYDVHADPDSSRPCGGSIRSNISGPPSRTLNCRRRIRQPSSAGEFTTATSTGMAGATLPRPMIRRTTGARRRS